MDGSTRKEIDWTELRPMNSLDTFSFNFEEFRREAEKAVNLVWQLSPDEKVRALFLWNRLATKLQEIIAKATDEMMNDIVELTSCTTSNSPQKNLNDVGYFVTPNPHADTQSSSDFDLEVSKVLRQTESEAFSESFLLDDTMESNAKGGVPEIPPETIPEYFPNIFSPPCQSSCDLTSTSTCGTMFSSVETENTITPSITDMDLSVVVTPETEKSWNCTPLVCSEKLTNEKEIADSDPDPVSASNSNSNTFQKRFKCTECTCSFSTKGNLNVHVRKHSGERPYACTKCPVRFTSGGNLRRHLLSHQGLKPYQCSMCESRFTEKKSLLIHQRSHSGEKPYVCPQCNKGFAQSSILQAHMLVHSKEKPFLCHQCGKSFKHKQQLAAHEVRHRGAKNHTCDVNYCDASFFTKGDLTRHHKTHLGVKPFKCNQCEKAFMRRETLIEHGYRHSGVKPMQCSKCDKSFNDLSNYHKHIKQH